MATNPYPEPYNRDLWEGKAEPGTAKQDYMVAVDGVTGDVVAVWPGAQKRLSLGDHVVQYQVPNAPSPVVARRTGQYFFRARKPGV